MSCHCLRMLKPRGRGASRSLISSKEPSMFAGWRVDEGFGLATGFRWGNVNVATFLERAGGSTGCQGFSSVEGGRDARALLSYMLLWPSVVFGSEKSCLSGLLTSQNIHSPSCVPFLVSKVADFTKESSNCVECLVIMVNVKEYRVPYRHFRRKTSCLVPSGTILRQPSSILTRRCSMVGEGRTVFLEMGPFAVNEGRGAGDNSVWLCFLRRNAGSRCPNPCWGCILPISSQSSSQQEFK